MAKEKAMMDARKSAKVKQEPGTSCTVPEGGSFTLEARGIERYFMSQPYSVQLDVRNEERDDLEVAASSTVQETGEKTDD